MSVEPSVTVVKGGIASLPEVIEPDAAAVQMAWVVPMSWQLRVSTPLLDTVRQFLSLPALLKTLRLKEEGLTHLQR